MRFKKRDRLEDQEQSTNKVDVLATLWEVAGKVRAIGELFGMSAPEPGVSEIACKGIASLLSEIADDLDLVRDFLDEEHRSMSDTSDT